MAYSVPGAALRLRRARAAHRQGDDGIHHDKHHQAYVDKVNAALEGTGAGRRADRGRAAGSRPGARRQAQRGQKQRRRPLQPLAVLGEHEPGRRWRARRRACQAISSAFGSFANFQAKLKETGVNQFGSGWAWLVLDGSGLAVIGSRQPGQPDLRRQDAAAGRRRVGARLLPEVPEPPPRLHRGVVERRQLEQGRGALRAGPRSRRPSSSVEGPLDIARGRAHAPRGPPLRRLTGRAAVAATAAHATAAGRAGLLENAVRRGQASSSSTAASELAPPRSTPLSIESARHPQLRPPGQRRPPALRCARASWP